MFFVSYRLVLPNILQSYFEKFTRILHLRLLSAILFAMPADHYRHQPFQKSLYDVTWQYDHLQPGVFLRLCIDEFVWFVFYVFPFSNEQHNLSLLSCFSPNLYICVLSFLERTVWRWTGALPRNAFPESQSSWVCHPTETLCYLV